MATATRYYVRHDSRDGPRYLLRETGPFSLTAWANHPSVNQFPESRYAAFETLREATKRGRALRLLHDGFARIVREIPLKDPPACAKEPR